MICLYTSISKSPILQLTACAFLLASFFCILSTILVHLRRQDFILKDIARRRSLSNADRHGEKIKFYIAEEDLIDTSNEIYLDP